MSRKKIRGGRVPDVLTGFKFEILILLLQKHSYTDMILSETDMSSDCVAIGASDFVAMALVHVVD